MAETREGERWRRKRGEKMENAALFCVQVRELNLIKKRKSFNGTTESWCVKATSLSSGVTM